MRDLHLAGDGPQRLSLGPQRGHLGDSLLLARVLDEIADVAASESERHDPAEVSATGFLIGFALPDALADAVALGLGERGGDRQKQLS